MKRSERTEFDKLASASCERTLSADEQARLESLLAEHYEARRDWLDYCRLHVELGLHNRAQAITRRVQSRITGGFAASESAAKTTTTKNHEAASPDSTTTRRQRASLSKTTWVAIAATLAASLLLMFNVLVERPDVAEQDRDSKTQIASSEADNHRLPKRRPEVVAVLRTSAAGENSPAQERVILAGEELDLLESRAQLEMTGGASLFVEAPARIKFESSDHVRLLSGSLSAQLSEWATGFVVDTNAMRLIDLGTAFAVTAESATVAEVQVLQGLVRVQPSQHAEEDLRGFLLGEGEGVRVDGQKAIREQVNLESDAVRQRIEELARLDAYQAIVTRNTGIGLQEGEEDPNWRITRVASEALVATPRYAVVCESHLRYSVNEPQRSQWVSVWQGNEPLPAESTYTFQTSIDLTGYDERSVHLIGQVLADNGVREIRLNGKPVNVEGWVDNLHRQEFRREEFHVIEILEGFQPGINTIEFDVWNGGEFHKHGTLELESVPNPMALRVEWQAFGRPTNRL